MLAWLESLTVLEQVLLYIAIPATLLLLLQTILLLVGLGGEQEANADSPEGSALLDADASHDFLDLDGDGVPDAPADFDLHDGDLHCDVCSDAHAGDIHWEDVHSGDFHDGDAHADHAHHGEGNAGPLHILTLRGIVAFLTLFGWSGLLFCQIGLHWLLALFLAVQIGIIGMVAVAFILREALRLQSDGTLDIRNALGQPGTVYLTIPAERTGPGKVNVLVQEQMREFEAVTEEETPILTGADVFVIGITQGDTLIVRPLIIENNNI